MHDRPWIGALLTAAIVVGMPVAAHAQSTIDWTSTEPLTGVVVDGELVLEVDGAGVYPLVVIDDPGVEPPSFALEGTVRHQDVVGIAYLEMWTVLPDESRYFTRTLAESGSLGYMTGTSGERPFSLPFELGEGGPTPARLEVNLVTEGSGRFWLGPIAITGGEAGSVSTTSSTQPVSTTTSASAVTTSAAAAAATTDEGQVDGLWWGLGLVLAAGALGALGWSRSVRRRRAEEQRRMNAMDSLKQ